MRGKHHAPSQRAGRSSFGMAGLLVGLVMAMSMPVTAGPTEKVEVCHLEGNGSYHLISISENAFETHVDHGDVSPGDEVPGMAGYQFGADCAPEEIPDTFVASGSYANDLDPGKILDVSFSVYQEWGGAYTGPVSYSYEGNGNWFDATAIDVCVVSANEVTVLADIDDTNTSWTHGVVTLKYDSGALLYRLRALAYTSLAAGETGFASQCAVGSTGTSGPNGSLTTAS